MDVKFELNSNDRRNLLSSLALASILPVIVLGSGFVIYNESLNISGQNSAVITLNLNSDAPNSDAAAGGYRGSQSILPPVKPTRTTQSIEKIKIFDQVIIPDGIEPAIKPLNNMIEPTRISPPEQLLSSEQPTSLQRKPSSIVDDSMEQPLQATSVKSHNSEAQASSKEFRRELEIRRRFGKSSALKLLGQPYYPRSCRMGSCKRDGIPCEGKGTWKIDSRVAGQPPESVQLISSAGCALLDASIKKYLMKTPIPKIGNFRISFNFDLDN